MAIAPTLRAFRLDTASDPSGVPPDVAQALQNQTMTQAETVNALSKNLTRDDNFAGSSRNGLAFKTPASGDATTRVAHGMANPPSHVLVGRIQRADGAAMAVWSITWANVSGGQVEITFQGLVASTEYRASFLFE